MAPLDSCGTLSTARRVVIKIGSALLVDAKTGALRESWLRGLAEDVASHKAAGRDVLIVSSGSIALGRRILGLTGSGRLDEAQAAASVGQIKLAQAYQDALSRHGIVAAQVLVTLEDSEDRRRYLNTRATLRTLLALGTVPVVNENDTVATDEIRYGDNDRLGAQIASLAQADVLVLLSDVDGLYTANPRTDPAARHVPLVEAVTPQVEAMAGGAGSEGARGGMKTKLTAAAVAVQAGCAMVITKGDVERPLRALEQGARATWFRRRSDPKTARKQWILAMKPRGRLVVDAGAERALGQGKSLLAAGVTAVSGRFQRGDPVEIVCASGQVLTQGLCGYDTDEALKIIGLRSDQIADVLGHPPRTAMVHRDEMAL
ncbi:MAG: glutamate 5-kinase [Pseudomonadota bacterium]